MTLAALVCAYHESTEPGDGLRATLPLAGRTVVERQARLAAAAGADPVVILVERLPPDLVAAIDRMRGAGIGLVVARSVAEAAESVQPDDRLLLVADGLVADESHIARLADAEGAAILTLADHGDERFERIDAYARWAGLAMVDGAMLRRTAMMLQDWDLQSTLLRHAVQSGARQIAVRESGDGQLLVAERGEDLDEAEARLVQSAGAGSGDWASRYLLAPVEHGATMLLMPSGATPMALLWLAATLTGLAAYLFHRDWLWAGVFLFLLATPLEGVADRLAALRLQPKPKRGWWRHVLPALSGAALVTLGLSLAPLRGWGCLALAAATIAFLLALHGETRGQEGVPGRVWLAERKGMAWLLLPFAVTGFWTAGLAALAAYAALSFFWVQRHVHALAAGRHD